MAGLPDVTTIATNVAVFAAAIGAAAAGSLGAVKVIKKQFLEIFDKDDKPHAVGKIAGGTIMDNTSMLMLSESNRTLAESNDDLRECVRENTREVRELRNAIQLEAVRNRR